MTVVNARRPTPDARRKERLRGLEAVAVEPVAREAAVQRPGNHLGRVESDSAHVDASWVPSGLQHVDLPEQSIESHGPDDPYLTTACVWSYLTRRA